MIEMAMRLDHAFALVDEALAQDPKAQELRAALVRVPVRGLCRLVGWPGDVEGIFRFRPRTLQLRPLSVEKLGTRFVRRSVTRNGKRPSHGNGVRASERRLRHALLLLVQRAIWQVTPAIERSPHGS